MASSEKNFEQQWHDAFKDASFPPPSNMWERIAEELDDDKKQQPFFILWGIPAYVVSGVAATLILALSGLYFLNLDNDIPLADKTDKTEIVGRKEQAESPTSIPEIEKTSSTKDDFVAINKVSPATFQKNTLISKGKASTSSILTETPLKESGTREIIKEEKATSNFVNFIEESDQLRKVVGERINKLLGKDFEKYASSYTLKRNKLAYEAVEETQTPKLANKRPSWIGLISGMSPFKPNFQDGNLNAMASSSADAFAANNSNIAIKEGNNLTPSTGQSPSFELQSKNPVQQFASGRAFNFGIQAGKKITQRLALVSGLRYVQGRSPSNNNVYTINQSTGDINTFYQDYLTNGKSLANTVVAIEDVVNNEYQYLIIPVQLAYQVPLTKKMNLEFSGGVSADAFLKNTIESETTDVATLNASNSAFRPVGMSGLGGVRLTYLFDEKWELSVGSAFQRALVSNFNNNTSAKLNPQMVGVNYGVNYHF